MLTMRLQRTGKKHQPSFRLVIAERRSKLGGPPTEDLGSYDIFGKKAAFKRDRILHWLTQGAQATATVHNLLVREGIITAPKRKIAVRAIMKEATASEASAPTPVAAGSVPAAEAPPPEGASA